MKKKTIKLSVLLLLILMLALPQGTFAYNAFKETSSGIPTLWTPLFVPNTTADVASSWNEPRSSSGYPHKGVDQSVYKVDVGPMYSGGGTVIKTGNAGDCGGGIYQIIEYTNGSTTYYSLFFHLDEILIDEGTSGTPVYVSDKTAKTGATGTFNCGGNPAYHIHFEILSSYSALSSRVTVNPANYVDISISDQFTVFKNWSVSINGPLRNISIDAIDYNLGDPDPLNSLMIYYRQVGTSTWYSANMTETSTDSGEYTYSLYVGSNGYQVLIAGRRKSTEYWATYPALKTGADIGNSSTPNISGHTDWVVKTVY